MGVVHAKSINPNDMDDTPSTKVDLQGLKAQVQKVHIDGLSRTKDDIVIKSVEDVFNASDFQSVIMKVHEARYKLENLGCFTDVGVLIDTYEGPDALKEGIEVTFDVKENKLLSAHVRTDVGRNEGSLSTGGHMNNLFGRGEQLLVRYSYGSKRNSTFSTNYIKPLHDDMDARVTASVYQSCGEMGWSGFKEVERGMLFNFAFCPHLGFEQQLILESAWRHLSCLSKSTAFAVRENCGHTLKNSLKHEISYDDRDDKIFPTGGYFGRIKTEVAGLGGNIGFIKNEGSIQSTVPLFSDLTASTNVSVGHMLPLNSTKSHTISDRFILGGPMNFRGFHMGGVGPHSEGYALGAQSFWSAGIHVFSPLPLLPKNNFTDRFRLQLWINVGNIGDWKMNDGLVNTIRTILSKDVRLTYGLGLALNLASLARLELNYCIPLHTCKGDRTQHGLQFGISADVL